MKVCFETFGCRLNRAETLNMEALFLANGWTKTTGHSDADLIIVRGCSVTRRAQRGTEKFIAGLRAKYPAKRIFTLGCITDRTPEAMIENAMRAARRDGTFVDGAVPTSTARAYLKVQDGCSGKCSYCIVPKFRGASVSEDFDRVMDRARRFLDCGYTEIVLTGCNLSLYLSKGKRLADLLSALAGIDGGRHRIRLGSLEPGPAAAEAIDAIAQNGNICRFLHIPIQSASNRILAEMRRDYGISDLERLVSLASARIPDLGLGCDVIAGFPTESEYDFAATFDFVKRHPFTNIHAFPYSERPGTLAAKLANAVPKPLRSERARALTALVKDKRKAFARKFKGRKVEVVIEDASTLSGWTSEYLWCTAGMANGLKTPPRVVRPGQSLSRRSRTEMLVKECNGDILLADPV